MSRDGREGCEVEFFFPSSSSRSSRDPEKSLRTVKESRCGNIIPNVKGSVPDILIKLELILLSGSTFNPPLAPPCQNPNPLPNSCKYSGLTRLWVGWKRNSSVGPHNKIILPNNGVHCVWPFRKVAPPNSLYKQWRLYGIRPAIHCHIANASILIYLNSEIECGANGTISIG
jgi:hypothetical protein